MTIKSFLCAAAVSVVTLGFPLSASAQTYADGVVHDISTSQFRVVVHDSPTGQPTTLNARAGSRFFTLQAYDTSVVRMSDGSATVQEGVGALNQARLTIEGGMHGQSFAPIEVYATDQATTVISGGNFVGRVSSSAQSTLVINGGSFMEGVRMLQVRDQSSMTVNGGSFTSRNTSVASVFDSGSLNIHGGSFNGAVLSNGAAGTLSIDGGLFVSGNDQPFRIVNSGNSVTTIYGQSFNLPFGVIDAANFNSMLIGTLANGDAINVSLSNTRFSPTSMASIVLIQSAVPEPAAATLLLGGGVFTVWRARYRRQHA